MAPAQLTWYNSPMYLSLYNTLGGEAQEFSPIDADDIRMYTCGPTVYKDIHIGNLRTYLTSDILRRVLEFNGFSVTAVMNITDVGHMRVSSKHGRSIDPILEEASLHGRTPEEIALFYSEQFLKDMDKLNMKMPNVLPRATRHIPEMIAIIDKLLKKGYAYEAEGNIYFDVRKFQTYGQLSGNTLDKMEDLLEAVRVSLETDKRDSIDFALWKKADTDHAMQWDSPWGMGFPGWHIECSAMAQKYLGETFDIHAGGVDLIFPHHEDEIAQSESANGKKFVKYWLHTNYLTIDSEKMSRSKGNVYLLSDLAREGYSPLAYRYLTYQTHYRQTMNFTWEALAASAQALARLYFAASELPNPDGRAEEYEAQFTDALNDDLNMPQALAVVWKMLASKKIRDGQKAGSLRAMDDVLGLKIFETVAGMKKVPAKVTEMLEARERLRRQRKFYMADAMRIKIEKLGYVVDDTPEGARVMKKV